MFKYDHVRTRGRPGERDRREDRSRDESIQARTELGRLGIDNFNGVARDRRIWRHFLQGIISGVDKG